LALVLLVLLASLLFGLRGLVMHPAQGASIEHPHPGSSDTDESHQGHCPLCFLLLLAPHLTPALDGVWSLSIVIWLWMGAPRAKDEFLKAIAARGPPASQTARISEPFLRLREGRV
jgi:hypothetical protein